MPRKTYAPDTPILVVHERCERTVLAYAQALDLQRGRAPFNPARWLRPLRYPVHPDDHAALQAYVEQVNAQKRNRI